MGRMYGPYHPGLGLLGGLFWVALFALFIGLIAWAVARLATHNHHIRPWASSSAPPAAQAGPWMAPRDDALAAARMRYARGELDREAYFRMVEDLTGVPRPQEGSAPFGPYPPAPPPAAGPPAQPGA